MSETKHTPGPWTKCKKDMSMTPRYPECDIIPIVESDLRHLEQQRDDMLKALEACQSCDQYDPISVEIAQDKARAAIRKAKENQDEEA